MSWDSFPDTYRGAEVRRTMTAVRAGECVSIIGLSGAGKSNLLGFLAQRGREVFQIGDIRLVLVDCNRLPEAGPEGLFRLMGQSLHPGTTGAPEFEDLDAAVERSLREGPSRLCFLIDRFDLFAEPADLRVAGSLRALRDRYKYRLTYTLATRQPLPTGTEIAELFYAHTIRLGPLSEGDARWNVARYADRMGQTWDDKTVQALLDATWRYPSLLRAACEAHAAGSGLETEMLATHPGVRQRVEEFWAARPDPGEIVQAGLAGQPLLAAARRAAFDTTRLTAREKRLFDYLVDHAGAVCEKDDLVRAVWPEDQIYEAGVRDDSLAQVVRRLRVKIEPDPSRPRYLETIAGRGYLFNLD